MQPADAHLSWPRDQLDWCAMRMSLHEQWLVRFAARAGQPPTTHHQQCTDSHLLNTMALAAHTSCRGQPPELLMKQLAMIGSTLLVVALSVR